MRYPPPATTDFLQHIAAAVVVLPPSISPKPRPAQASPPRGSAVGNQFVPFSFVSSPTWPSGLRVRPLAPHRCILASLSLPRPHTLFKEEDATDLPRLAPPPPYMLANTRRCCQPVNFRRFSRRASESVIAFRRSRAGPGLAASGASARRGPTAARRGRQAGGEATAELFYARPQ